MAVPTIGQHLAVGSLLEGVPAHWQTLRFKAVLDRVDERNVDLSYPMASLKSSGEVVLRSSLGGRQEPDEKNLPKYFVARSDDLVVNPMWLVGGAIGVSGIDGAVSPDYRVFRARSGGIFPRYAHYLLRSSPYRDQYVLYTRAQTTFDRRVQQGNLDNMPLPIPPLDEQRCISDYLDRETAQIDKLIDEQQRLIDMLRERRVSAITEIISSPYTPFRKKTYSQWYPSVPGSWMLRRVKDVAVQVTDGAHTSPETDGGVYDFVSTRDLDAGLIDFEGSLKTTPETYDSMVRAGCQPRFGDILFSKDGTVGSTAVVRENRDFVVASSLVIITPDTTQVDSDFLVYVFASKGTKDNATSLMRGAGLPRISIANVRRLEVPLPPLDEQRRIVVRLNNETAKIDTLITESEKLIELSRERRSALITAAVTGQIDIPQEV